MPLQGRFDTIENSVRMRQLEITKKLVKLSRSQEMAITFSKAVTKRHLKCSRVVELAKHVFKSILIHLRNLSDRKRKIEMINKFGAGPPAVEGPPAGS